MSTDFRGEEGGKSELEVNDHQVNWSNLPRRDRTRAPSFLSVKMHPKVKACGRLGANSSNYTQQRYESNTVVCAPIFHELK